MNTLETLFAKNKSGRDYACGYVEYLARILKEMDMGAVETVMDLFESARQGGRTIFFIGNGGSAATCSHFANDFTLATRGTQEKPFKALSLCDNNALMLAISNDVGYEGLFVEQLKTLARRDDLLVSISASGNSKNLVKAVEYANRSGMVSVGMAGFSGGAMKDLCRHFIYIPSHAGEYGPAEDVALILDHVISSFLTYRIYGEKLGFRPEHVGYDAEKKSAKVAVG